VATPMGDERLELIAPTTQWEAAYLAFIDDFEVADELRTPGRNTQLARSDFPAFVQRLADDERGLDLAPGVVPSSTYWLLRHEAGGVTVLGVSHLRHALTPALEDVGGHFGYSIRPSARRCGYGTLILALTLPHARALGLTRVLVTCDTNNIGSARIIEKNGGMLACEGYSAQAGARVSRYWITL
jgi:predicted acetyltransferase